MPARRPEELLGAVGHELARQDGVVARRQLLAAGLRPHDLERLVRRRVLAPLCRGVLVDHTGPPTWRQRSWGAVLALGPAALVGPSALHLARGEEPRADAVVHVGIDGRRGTPAPLAGVSVRHLSRLDEVVMWHLGPPRQRLEEAVLDAALEAPDPLGVVGVLAAAVGSRLTTADRLSAVLARRPRAAGRRWLEGVLADVAGGTCSVLEHGQLVMVERPHGLPRATRQLAERGRAGRVYRDAAYGRAAYVELDGRLHERFGTRDLDLDRDLDVAAAGGATVRLGFGQVYDRPCRTAAGLSRFLLHRGLVFLPTGCEPACPVWEVKRALVRGSLAPGAGDPRT